MVTQPIQILSTIPFFLISLFILWRKIREDYLSSQIFGLAFLIYFSVIVYILTRPLYVIKFSEWVVIIVPVIIILVYCRFARMRLNEVMNALVPGILVSYLNYYVYAVFSGNTFLILAIIPLILLGFLFAYLEKNFKKLHWYKSGKVGFSGFVVLTILLAGNSIIAFVAPAMVFFSGKINAVILLLIAGISALGLWLLSRKVS